MNTRSPDRAMIRRILSEAFGWETVVASLVSAVMLWALMQPEPGDAYGPRCHPYGAQPQAASCQHDIAIAGDHQ